MTTYTPKGLLLPNPPTIVAENLLPDPFLLTRTWSQNGSTGTFTHVPAGGPNGNGYFEYDMLTANSASPMGIQLTAGAVTDADTEYFPIVPGETYNLSAWWYRTNTGQVQRVDITWLNATGGVVSTGGGSNLAIPQNAWTRGGQDFIAPLNAVYARPTLVWSGTYAGGTVLRSADAQFTRGPGIKDFAPQPITLDDGDTVKIGDINANLDRISLMGVGARPLSSSEHPALGSIDDLPGTIILETDNNGILVRRRGTNFGSFGLDANYRSHIPGNWQEWASNNPFSGWLTGDNNYKHVRVMMFGRLVFVHMEFQIGTGGEVLGSGPILPSQLPTNRDVSVENGYGGDGITAGPWPIGHASALIGGTMYTGRIMLINAQPVVRTIPATASTFGAAWSDTQPANWGVGDGGTFDYRYWST